jgi:hypothetical protein
VALASLATPAFADPPGNNGTIKVDAEAFDDTPGNEPHVDCTFQIDFYGFDKGDLSAKVTFETQPPTPTGADDQVVLLTDSVFIGEDDDSGGGSVAGLDASETYTLDFGNIEPNNKGEFHVKLTINAEGSQGADVKHKVFWVKPCVTPTPTPTPTPTTASPTPSHTPSHSATPSHTPSHSGKPTPPPTKSETPAPVPTAVPGGADAAGGGPGAGLVGLVLAAGGAVAGTAAIARRRFLHDS